MDIAQRPQRAIGTASFELKYCSPELTDLGTVIKATMTSFGSTHEAVNPIHMHEDAVPGALDDETQLTDTASIM